MSEFKKKLTSYLCCYDRIHIIDTFFVHVKYTGIMELPRAFQYDFHPENLVSS